MPRRLIARIALWAVLIYALFCVVAWFRADAVMYQVPPPTYPADDPSLIRLDVDGETVMARMTPATGDARATVIYAHGNGGDIGSPGVGTAEHLARLGLDVIAFDYRGYGRSDGSPSEAGTFEDIDAVHRYLVDERGVDPERIIVVGHSLGGGPAAWLAEHREVGGLMLWSTFTSAFEVAIPTWLLPFDRYETEDRLGDVHVPVAVVHGDADEIIPVELGRADYAAANEPKRELIVPGAHHNDVVQVAGDDFDHLVVWLVDRLPS